MSKKKTIIAKKSKTIGQHKRDFWMSIGIQIFQEAALLFLFQFLKHPNIYSSIYFPPILILFNAYFIFGNILRFYWIKKIEKLREEMAKNEAKIDELIKKELWG